MIQPRSIMSLLAEVGLEAADRAALDSFVFDGKTVALRRTDKDPATLEELLHEACHWVVATTEERTLPEYGLGAKRSAHLDFKGHVEPVVSKPDRQTRELAALLLHQRVGNAVGLGFKKDFPMDRFIGVIDKDSQYAGWRDRANQWLAQVGVEVEAVANRMVQAYTQVS